VSEGNEDQANGKPINGVTRDLREKHIKDTAQFKKKKEKHGDARTKEKPGGSDTMEKKSTKKMLR